MRTSASACSIRIDPTALSPGVHYAEIRAIDVDRPSDGPIITVPVTVIRPVMAEDAAVPSCRKLGVLQPGEWSRASMLPSDLLHALWAAVSPSIYEM